jgi:GLPGLI family protein
MKLIKIILTLSFSSFLYSQDNLIVDFSSFENNNMGEYSLITTDYYSNWVLNHQTSNTNLNALGNETFYFMKNKKQKKIFYETNILTKKIAIEDSLDSMSWIITSSYKKILGFNCKEAKTTFRGRDYVAYFTEEIAINDGPWKFGGLPGLILEVKSIDGYLSYVANKITRNQKHDINLPQTKKTKFLSWMEYEQMFIKIYENYINLIKTSEDMSLGSEVNINVQTKEIIYPKIQTKSGYVIKRN